MIPIILAYLFGSVSFAIILTKIFNLPDPRHTGSNNPGATNMLRLSGKKIGALTLLGDVLKAFIVVVVAKYYNYNSKEILFISLACFIGHLFPIYFKFKGGKGVAVTLGLLLGLNYVLGLCALLIWIVIAYITKYSSLAALLTSPILSIIYFLFFDVDYTFGLLCVISCLLAFTHHKNIFRLINKKEPKLFNVTN